MAVSSASPIKSKKNIKKPQLSVEEKINSIHKDLTRLMDLWMETKSYLIKAFLNKEISEDEEAKFLEMKTTLSSLSRSLDSRTQEYLSVGADEIEKILKAAVNLKVLSGINSINKKGLYGKWHVAYIQMHRTKGALNFFLEGYRPKKKKTESAKMKSLEKNLASIFGSKITGDDSDEDESIWVKLATVVAGVGAAGLMLFLAFNYF